MSAPLARRQARQQRGAAALIVVMLLFFVISLVAAYTSRNLIFEQRTGANQYRSTQALEAADAGIEWAIGQLNAGRITNSCAPSTDDAAAGEQGFRERYLNVNGATGDITPRTASGGGSIAPRCVLDTSSSAATGWKWLCNCPQTNTASSSLTVPTTAGPAPAFIVLMQSGGARTDLIQLASNSCTRPGTPLSGALGALGLTDCLNFNAVRGGTGDGVAAVRTLVALRGALTRPPAGALTVAGSPISLAGGANLTVINQDIAANGVTIHTAAAFAAVPTAGLSLTGLPGVAPSGTLVTDDATVAPPAQGTLSSADRRFAGYFGLLPAVYRRQPGLPVLDCSSSCDADDINLAMLRNPGRPIWLAGSTGTVALDANVGSAAAPALLIVEGDLSLASGVTVHGLIYGRKAAWTWTADTTATLRGGVVAEGSLSLAGAGSNTTVIYDAAVLKALRVGYGTFVRVPGSWRDF